MESNKVAELIGKEGFGVVFEKGNLIPLGNLLNIQVGANILFTFSNEKVLFFTPLRILSLVEDSTFTPDGHTNKDFLENLYIGGKPFKEFIQNINFE